MNQIPFYYSVVGVKNDYMKSNFIYCSAILEQQQRNAASILTRGQWNKCRQAGVRIKAQLVAHYPWRHCCTTHILRETYPPRLKMAHKCITRLKSAANESARAMQVIKTQLESHPHICMNPWIWTDKRNKLFSRDQPLFKQESTVYENDTVWKTKMEVYQQQCCFLIAGNGFASHT